MDIRTSCEELGRLFGQVIGEYLVTQLEEKKRNLSAPEAANVLDMNVQYVRQMCRDGKFGDYARQDDEGRWVIDVAGYLESKES